MSQIAFDLDLSCSQCNEALKFVANFTGGNGDYNARLDVEPCSSCLEEAKDEGVEEGIDSRDVEVADLELLNEELRKEISKVENELNDAKSTIRLINSESL